MTFEDLPKNWDQLPLVDPGHCANVVDLLVSDRDRTHNSVLLLSCTRTRIPIPAPVIISDVPWNEDPQPLLDIWAQLLTPDQSILIASSHPGTGRPLPHLAWLDKAVAGFARLGTPTVGAFIAARDGVYRRS